MKHKGIYIFFGLITLFSMTSFALPSFAQTKTTASKQEQIKEVETKKEPVILYKDNWFDFVNEYWEKYTTPATVIDINSGISYEVLRVGGYNHADVEPIDSYNTSIMHNIYSNQWQWTRRPVWVKIKDRYIAASINGYPHAYDYITGNDMTGHTCIHFYKSRTHGTNNWDPEHRECVEIAYASQELFDNYVDNK